MQILRKNKQTMPLVKVNSKRSASLEKGTYLTIRNNKRRIILEPCQIMDLSWNFLKICDVLLDLLPFVQFFKKSEEHPGRSVTFSKVTLLHGCFSRF